MSQIHISKVEWEKISVGTVHDPDATMTGNGIATLDDHGLRFVFPLNKADDEAIDAILQQAARREIKRRLDAVA